jgi:hypothetical protein
MLHNSGNSFLCNCLFQSDISLSLFVGSVCCKLYNLSVIFKQSNTFSYIEDILPCLEILIKNILFQKVNVFEIFISQNASFKHLVPLSSETSSSRRVKGSHMALRNVGIYFATGTA